MLVHRTHFYLSSNGLQRPIKRAKHPAFQLLTKSQKTLSICTFISQQIRFMTVDKSPEKVFLGDTYFACHRRPTIYHA